MGTLSSPALVDLLTSVRLILKQPDPTNSFWSDEEIRMYLNEAIRIYFVEVTHNNEGLFTTRTDLDITSGSDLVSLPADCFEIRTLSKKDTNGYVPLNYINNLNLPHSTTSIASGSSYFPYYYLQGNSIVLRPVPDFSETAGLRLEYIQFPDTLVNGGDSLTAQLSPIFKQLVETYAVYKCKLSESYVNGGSMHVSVQAHLGDLYRAFQNAIVMRSKSPVYVQPFNPGI